MNTIQNPILPGFAPDASALHVGEDYYIATSTFEWWPGIEIYHSQDLVNWEWAAAPIARRDMVPSELLGNYNSGSLWAPHLSYADGLFWLVYTDVKSSTAFKDTLNYVVTAPKITGPWSEPTLVTASGFDPALFHDDDGHHYFLNMLFDWRLENPGFAGTVIQEFDPATRQLVGERKHFYRGTSLGVCEGPQILKKDGWYYLLCAAGGTGYLHAATVARAKTLDGPWEDSPYFPLLTARDDAANPLQKSGHACFVEIGGEWYITHICARPLTERGNCTLGRETALQKIEWANGWPRLANGTHHPDLVIPAPKAAGDAKQILDHSERVTFAPDKGLPHTFKTPPQADAVCPPLAAFCIYSNNENRLCTAKLPAGGGAGAVLRHLQLDLRLYHMGRAHQRPHTANSAVRLQGFHLRQRRRPPAGRRNFAEGVRKRRRGAVLLQSGRRLAAPGRGSARRPSQ